MSVRLVMKNSLPASVSPYRLLDDHGREIAWANEFLDAQKVRQLSLRSLRAYAYDLLHLARWFRTTRYSLARLTQSLLLDYVRHQLEQQPSPNPKMSAHWPVNRPSVDPSFSPTLRTNELGSRWRRLADQFAGLSPNPSNHICRVCSALV